MVESTNIIKVYEDNGEEKLDQNIRMAVMSHTIYSDRVIISCKGINVTVLREELVKAVYNATNI